MIIITEKEVYSDSAYVHRLGTDMYFKRSTKLANDSYELFEEVEELPKEELYEQE